MVSGFLTAVRPVSVFSGLASWIRIELKLKGSLGFKKLKISFTVILIGMYHFLMLGKPSGVY